MQTTKRGSCREKRSNKAPPGRFFAPPRLSRKPASETGGSTTTPISRGAPPRFARWCPNRPISLSGRAVMDMASRNWPYGSVASPSNSCQCLPESFAVNNVSSGRQDRENSNWAEPRVDFFRLTTQCNKHVRRSRGAGSSGHRSTPLKAMSRNAFTSRLGGSGGWGRFKISKGGGGGGSYLQTFPSEPNLSTTYHRLNRRRCCTTHSALTFFDGLRASSMKSSSSWS